MTLLLFTGCDKKNEEIEITEDTPIKEEQPIQGGELSIPVTQFETLNPILNTNTSVYHMNMLIYDGLISLNEKFEARPALAKSWSYTESGILVDLAENVTWHDGKPFTAEDVKFTIEALKGSLQLPNAPNYAAYTRHITNIKVLGDLKLLIEFDSLAKTSVELLNFPIISKSQFKSIDNVYKSLDVIPVGTGRYKVTAYSKLKSLTLIANDNYWGQRPYISNISVKIVPDKEAALTSVEADDVSIAEANALDWEKFAEDKTLKLHEFVTLEYEFLAFNFNRELFRDKNIRKAFAYAIDRHTIVNEVYYGHATITDTPIHPDSWLYAENENKYGKDIQKAKELLIASKWIDANQDGLVEDDQGRNLSFKLMVNNDSQERVKIAELMAKQLKQVGIEVIVEAVGWEEYYNRIYAGNYDVTIGGWQLSPIPDFSFAFHTNYLGRTNFLGYSNQELDQLLIEMPSIQQTANRRQKYVQFQRVFAEELPCFSLFFKNHALVMKNYVRGNMEPRPFNIYQNIEVWYVNKNE